MPNYVKPTVKLIASTEINEENLETYLSEIGASGWETDAGSGAEKLIEVAGKRCYKSFNVDLNPNLSKVRNGDNKLYIGNILKSRHGCYDHKTEVMTTEGWKLFSDLTKSDKLATLSEDGVLEYQEPTELQQYDYTGAMVRVKARQVDLLVTPNHRMFVCKTSTKEGRKKQNFEIVEASDLLEISHCYRKDAFWSVEDSALDSNIYWLLGFAIGDGHLAHKSNQLNFHLKKPRKIEALVACLNKLDVDYSHKGYKFYVKLPTNLKPLFNGIYNESRDKQIPASILLNSSKEQLTELYNGLVASDGHIDKNGSISYYTTSYALNKQLQQLALHIGIAAHVGFINYKEHDPKGFGTKPVMTTHFIYNNLRPEVNKWAGCKGKVELVENYSGKVYCATVPNGLLYVKRNGIPVWSGNSVLEHGTCSFAIENVSRIITHEKVRHRPDNYSQESMRFVRPTNINFVMGESYSKHLSKERVKKIKELHDETLTYLENVQKQLELICDIDNPVMPFSHKKEFQSDNRRLLPEGIATGIIVTGNHRSWRHQIAVRTSEHAESEIRYAFNKIAVILKEKYPAIYQDMTPSKQCKIFGETCYEYTFEFDKV